MELNKIVAAVLLAGIIAMVSGIIAEMLVSPKPLARNAFAVSTGAAPATEAAPAAASGVDVPPITPLLANADPAAGQTVARACVACHTFEKGGQNKVGPNQWDLVGAAMGHAQGFNYSAAIQARHAGGDTWTYENLNKFLAAPRQFMPGTTMAFAGIRNERDRANLIAWLRTNSDNPPPLPSPSETSAAPAGGAGAAPAAAAGGGTAAGGSAPAETVSGGGGAGGAAGASGAATGSAPATPPAGSPPAGAPASEAAPAAAAPAGSGG